MTILKGNTFVMKYCIGKSSFCYLLKYSKKRLYGGFFH